MPLVTQASQIVGKAQSSQPSLTPEGSLWYDTSNDILKATDGTTYNQVGRSSFATAAVVSQSTTIGDYTTPSAAIDTECTAGAELDTFTTTTDDGGPLGNGTITKRAQKFTASYTYLGFKIAAITFQLSKNNSPTGTITAKHYDGSTVQKALGSTLDASTVSASKTEYTFTFATPAVLAANDYITIEYSGGDATNYITFWRVNAGGKGNCQAASYAGSWTDGPEDAYFKLYGKTYNLYDTSTSTKWISSSENNPNAYVDMGSALNLCAIALHYNATDTTETEIKIQSSADAVTWTDKRKITTSNLTDAAWNYYRFNIAGGARYIRVYGTGTSKVLALNEIKVLKKTDAEIFADLGILEISNSNTTLGADGT